MIHLEEIMTRYDPDLIWVDGDWAGGGYCLCERCKKLAGSGSEKGPSRRANTTSGSATSIAASSPQPSASTSPPASDDRREHDARGRYGLGQPHGLAVGRLVSAGQQPHHAEPGHASLHHPRIALRRDDLRYPVHP